MLEADSHRKCPDDARLARQRQRHAMLKREKRATACVARSAPAAAEASHTPSRGLRTMTTWELDCVTNILQNLLRTKIPCDVVVDGGIAGMHMTMV